jgi:putative methionine-R-sulfoxide reductase with GAF domain
MLLDDLRDILKQNITREDKAARIAEATRECGNYSWVGIYEVDIERGMVLNIACIFPMTKGLTSRAIASDSDYLTAPGNTRSEIIVPVLHETSGDVVGTIDVESERMCAFDSAAQVQLEDFWKR